VKRQQYVIPASTYNTIVTSGISQPFFRFLDIFKRSF